jgi:hypothetical protein
MMHAATLPYHQFPEGMSQQRPQYPWYECSQSKAHPATAVKASFPPTSLALQVYPYKTNPSDDVKAELDEDNNCLVYKQMTQHHDLPQDLAYLYGGVLSTQAKMVL